MSRQVSPSTSRPYGILRVTRLWGRSRATLYRHRRCEQPGSRRRPGPVGPMPDEALVEAIRELLAASPFHGEGHRKIWARLRLRGLRTAARRVRRIMKEHGLLAPHRPAPRAAHPHDGTIVTERVDQVWGTDMTETFTTAEDTPITVVLPVTAIDPGAVALKRRPVRLLGRFGYPSILVRLGVAGNLQHWAP